MKRAGQGTGRLEEAWRDVWRDMGARWPGVLIGLGTSAVALALNASPAKRGATRVLQRLSILGAAFSWVNLFFIRPWQLHWGATWEEVHRAMRGDELVPHPLMEATRALSIEAPPSAVWPWLVQMGYGRAGFYAYDRLDNAGVPSADRLIPELQHLKVGDVVLTGPGAGFTVEGLEPEQCLELVIRDRGQPIISSVLLLEPLGVRRTRLVSRVRMRPALRLEAILLYLAMDFGELWMVRKMMRGLKERAERHPVPSWFQRSTIPPGDGPGSGSEPRPRPGRRRSPGTADRARCRNPIAGR